MYKTLSIINIKINENLIEMNAVFIGFDFSMNKPAATVLYKKQFKFFIWPAKLPKKYIDQYTDCGVIVQNRDIDAVKVEKKHNSQIVLEHTKRSIILAKMIVDDIQNYLIELGAENEDLFISSEGLSFNSKGDAALNLASYKGVFLAEVLTRFLSTLKGLYTYPPITMKAVAGCAKKGALADKHKMITAFKNEPIENEFKTALCNGQFVAEKNYAMCVDDIVDSYWAVKTMLKKEGFIK